MTKKEFLKYFKGYFNTNVHSYQVWKWNRGMIQTGDFSMSSLVMPDEVRENIMNNGCIEVPYVSHCVTTLSPSITYGTLAPLPPAVCPTFGSIYEYGSVCKQKEVDNSMYTTKTTANSLEINVNSQSSAPAKSDIQSQRDMILQTLKEEFLSWRDPKIGELRELFNMNAPERPKSFAAMAEAIKAGKYTIDQKKIDKRLEDLADDYGYDVDADDFDADEHLPFWYGVTFTDLPKADQKGFEAALKAWERAKKEAQEDIMVLEPSQGLTTLRALRDWKPVGKAN